MVDKTDTADNSGTTHRPDNGHGSDGAGSTSPAVRLADLTTLHVGGNIHGDFVLPQTVGAFTAAIDQADSQGSELLVVGGGSNLLASDEPFGGTIIKDARQDIRYQDIYEEDTHTSTCVVEASAGTLWDDLVVGSIEHGLSGLEALSGIPGTVGAAPVQNIGAYGREIAETIVGIRAWDRELHEVTLIPAADLELSYRSSILKTSRTAISPSGKPWGLTGRWVVIDVLLRLLQSNLSASIRYQQLAASLDAQIGDYLPTQEVREHVLKLRHSKGMCLNPTDYDTWSSGSFFMNPVLSAQDAEKLLPPDAPQFPTDDGSVKTSAAWLIEHAGFSRGYFAGDNTAASLSTKHVLALTNRGGASAEDLLQLARTVRSGVYSRFGVMLEPESVLVGLAL